MISLIPGALMVSIGCSKKFPGFISGPGSDPSCALVCLRCYEKGRGSNRYTAYRVEEKNPDGVCGSNDGFPLLDLQSSVKGFQQMRSLHVFICSIIARFLHGARTIDAEQDHITFALEPLSRNWIRTRGSHEYLNPRRRPVSLLGHPLRYRSSLRMPYR